MTERIAEYVTVDGDRLDKLCYQHYRHEPDTIEWVLSNNPELRDQPMLYPAGVVIKFLPLPSKATAKTINPWE